MSLPERTLDSTLTPSRRGSASRNAAKSSLPSSNARSGHRNPGFVLAADHQIDTTAPRVGIDEQRIASPTAQARSRTPTPRRRRGLPITATTAPLPLAVAAGLRSLGQHGDELGLVGGQGQDVLGADGDRGLPVGGAAGRRG